MKKTGIVYDDLRDWDSGHDKLSLEDRNNPGFMVGLSGIGYVLLRKREKELPGVFAEKQIGGSGYVFGGL